MENKILDVSYAKPNFEFAGFDSRVGAYFIDLFPIILIVGLVCNYVLGFNYFADSDETAMWLGEEYQEKYIAKYLVRYSSILIWIFYSIIMDASKYQGTYGKINMKIKVVDENGNRITLAKSIIRNLSKILSYIVLMLGFIWVLFNKERRGWHDMIANTYIIKGVKIQNEEELLEN